MLITDLYSKEGTPWFIVAIDEYGYVIPRIYVSQTVPEQITTNVKINRSVRNIPGGHTSAVAFANFEPETLSLTLKVGNYNSDMGVSDDILFFDSLRKPAYNVLDDPKNSYLSASPPFQPPPRVLYWWGTHRLVPLVYFVDEVKTETGDFNQFGKPQYLSVDLVLSLDTGNLVYKAERTYARTMSLVKAASGAVGDIFQKKDIHPLRRDKVFGGFKFNLGRKIL